MGFKNLSKLKSLILFYLNKHLIKIRYLLLILENSTLKINYLNE